MSYSNLQVGERFGGKYPSWVKSANVTGSGGVVISQYATANYRAVFSAANSFTGGLYLNGRYTGTASATAGVTFTADNQLAGDTIEEQTEATLRNVEKLLQAAGCELGGDGPRATTNFQHASAPWHVKIVDELQRHGPAKPLDGSAQAVGGVYVPPMGSDGPEVPVDRLPGRRRRRWPRRRFPRVDNLRHSLMPSGDSGSDVVDRSQVEVGHDPHRCRLR